MWGKKRRGGRRDWTCKKQMVEGKELDVGRAELAGEEEPATGSSNSPREGPGGHREFWIFWQAWEGGEGHKARGGWAALLPIKPPEIPGGAQDGAEGPLGSPNPG